MDAAVLLAFVAENFLDLLDNPVNRVEVVDAGPERLLEFILCIVDGSGQIARRGGVVNNREAIEIIDDLR